MTIVYSAVLLADCLNLLATIQEIPTYLLSRADECA